MTVNASKLRVKRLEWEVDVTDGEQTFYADTILGRYSAWVQQGVAYVLIPDSLTNRLPIRQPVGLVIEDAKHAAQDHFERTILGMVERMS